MVMLIFLCKHLHIVITDPLVFCVTFQILMHVMTSSFEG